MATRSTTTADVSAPNTDLTDLNRRIAEEAAAATTAEARNRDDATPAAKKSTTSDTAA